MKNLVKASLLTAAFGVVSCGSVNQSAADDKFDYVSTAYTNTGDTLWRITTELPLGKNWCDRVEPRGGMFMDKFTNQEVGISGPADVITEEVPQQFSKSVEKLNPLRAHYNVVVISESGEKTDAFTTRYKPNLRPRDFRGTARDVTLKDTSGVKHKVPKNFTVSYSSAK